MVDSKRSRRIPAPVPLGGWMRLRRLFLQVLVCVAVATSSLLADDAIDVKFFHDKIEPLLKEHCFACHSNSAEKVQGGLRLDSRAAILRGGDSGPAVVIGKSESSLLIQAIRHEAGLAMPPKKEKLSEGIIVDFTKWIDGGLPDPQEESTIDSALTQLNEGRRHWAFQPVRKAVPPTVNDAAWERTPVDRFILARLEQRGWKPAPPAERADLIRRVSFDLTGLPPAPEEIVAFVNDADPHAYPKLVDRLLGSRQNGERSAQHWLDVVRYAETEGFEYDYHIPDAWRYRDYVIDSFNVDKPFDRFLLEQLAGDEIEPDSIECQTASIFHRLGPVRRNAGNPEIALSRNEVLTERTDIIGAAFLGLTVGCARCHNHKLEPISQKDYYRLQAYLASTEEHNITLASAEEKAEWETVTKRLKEEIDALRAKAGKATGAEKNELNGQITKLEGQLPAPLAMIPSTCNDNAKRTAIHVLKRGVWENKGEPVGPRPLSVLMTDDCPELAPDVANPKTQLARWLTSPDHPLTARVIVNRLWQQHFGIGLVKTANDFGLKGDRPSHPELMDWLAATLVENGWRLKSIHRLIVMSNAYQQSNYSPASVVQEAADPENRLVWHVPRRRLSAEEVRDAMLFASDRLNLKTGGPSVIVPVEPELVQLLYKPAQWSVTKDASEHDRRSIYLISKRNLRLPFLENFDAPGLQASCARRESSTHAPQALELLNGSLSNDLAKSFAQRLEHESNGDRAMMVQRAFQLAIGRSPRADERQRSLKFLDDQPVSEFALAIFNLNEFLYVR
jgi:hypothetical protein